MHFVILVSDHRSVHRVVPLPHFYIGHLLVALSEVDFADFRPCLTIMPCRVPLIGNLIPRVVATGLVGSAISAIGFNGVGSGRVVAHSDRDIYAVGVRYFMIFSLCSVFIGLR